MTGDASFKEVRFDIYCQKCAYRDRKEAQDPCNDCLEVGMREESSKPEFFKEK